MEPDANTLANAEAQVASLSKRLDLCERSLVANAHRMDSIRQMEICSYKHRHTGSHKDRLWERCVVERNQLIGRQMYLRRQLAHWVDYLDLIRSSLSSP